MYQQTILVVEDSDDIRLLMKMILEMKGYRVLEATNGLQAVESALKEIPNLILMDLSMPVMDGWEATKQLRQYERMRDLPIVALSAHCTGKWREEAMEAGCNDCVQKPVSDEALNRMFSKFLAVH
jgi:CheY-like chemotaxis protein